MAFFVFYEHLFIFCGHLDILCSLGIYFPRFGMLYQEKSGNPAIHAKI
jgi:hypothetical protein